MIPIDARQAARRPDLTKTTDAAKGRPKRHLENLEIVGAVSDRVAARSQGHPEIVVQHEAPTAGWQPHRADHANNDCCCAGWRWNRASIVGGGRRASSR